MTHTLGNILSPLGIQVLDSDIYSVAFTHRSYLNEVKSATESNERLEFLGDAVLSLIVSSFIYTHRPTDAEGKLTNLRSFIVRTESLAKVSLHLKLGDLLKLSKGEEISGGRENPQILANTYEALIGAIFMDQGIDSAMIFVQKTLLPFFEKELHEGAPRDFKSILQEIVQEKYQSSPKYHILEAFGPDHAKQFKVGVYIKDQQVGQGEGSNKQQAEELAAQKALDELTDTLS